MAPLADAGSLLAANTPAAFWRLLDGRIGAGLWEAAGRETMGCLAGLPGGASDDLPSTLAAILGEGQFGPGHWQLSWARRLFYSLRPAIPHSVRALLRGPAARRCRHRGPLRWPIEDRYVQFQLEMVRRVLRKNGQESMPYIHFWPHGCRFALVLTHDVEGERGQRFVRQLAALEEAYGFRSSFNFVPEAYRVDLGLLSELRERGFEVGVHGLRHDGRLFSSPRIFQERARRINEVLRAWQAVGFRSPLTHRHPQWMQALEIEYDSSFFDTDPFESIPGGTMSIWPFMLGRFVELPYTLAQDHLLMHSLGQRTPRLWLEKVDFIRQYCGMALLNSHPDYLLKPAYLAIYEHFLRQMSAHTDHWRALPRDVARWWRRRAEAAVTREGDGWAIEGLPEATVGQLRPCADTVTITPDSGDIAAPLRGDPPAP